MYDYELNIEGREEFQETLDKLSEKGIKIPKLTEDTLQGIYAFAYSYYQHRKYDEALSMFRLLSFMNPHDPKYWMGLGATEQMLKKYPQALQAYTFAALIDENDPYPFFYSADCLFALGHADHALKCLESVEKIAASQEHLKDLLKQVTLIRQAWAAPAPSGPLVKEI